MKEEKNYSLERDTRNVGSSKWAVVGKFSGTIYYSGTRFDCCSYIGNNEAFIDQEEQEKRDGKWC